MGWTAVAAGAIIGGVASDWNPEGILLGAAGGAVGGFGGAFLGGGEGAAAGASLGASTGTGLAAYGAATGEGLAAYGAGGYGLGLAAPAALSASELGIGAGLTGGGLAAGGLGGGADISGTAGGGFGGGATASDYGLDSFLGQGANLGGMGLAGPGEVGMSAVPGTAASAGGGILPASVSNIANQIKGLPWQGIAQAGQVGANLLNMSNLGDYQKQIAQAARTADPFASQRAQYQQQLAALQANPASVTQSPGYQAQLEQGLQALQRTQAAQGFLGSGNAQQQNAQYAMQLQNQYYQQQLQNLMQLSGANIQGSPTAGSIQAGGAANYMGGQAQNLANMTYSLQNIANSQQPQSSDQMSQNIQDYLF